MYRVKGVSTDCLAIFFRQACPPIKIIKNKLFDEKQLKKSQKSICKPKTAFFILNSPLFFTDTYKEKIVDKKLSVEHTQKY